MPGGHAGADPGQKEEKDQGSEGPSRPVAAPAGPGDVLELEYRIAGDAVSFKIRPGSRRIAGGKFADAAWLKP